MYNILCCQTKFVNFQLKSKKVRTTENKFEETELKLIVYKLLFWFIFRKQIYNIFMSFNYGHFRVYLIAIYLPISPNLFNLLC